MPAGYVNLQIEIGATFNQELELSTNDVPMDLTGFVGSCKMRKSYYSNFNVYPLTVTINNPPTDGKITISATAAETATFKAGRYVYDVKISAGAVADKVIYGIVEVVPIATR